MLKKRWKIVLLVVGLLLAAGAGAFGPIVRGRARAAGARFGAEVTIDTVLPAWGGARLRGVHVGLEDVPGAAITLDEVRVETGSPRHVRIKGGKLLFSGTPQELSQQLAALRSRLSTGSGDAPAGGGTDLAVEGLAVDLPPNDSGISASAQNVSVARVEGGWSVDAGTLTVGYHDVEAKAAEVHLEVNKSEAGYVLRKLSTAALIAEAGKKPEGAAPLPAGSSDAAPKSEPGAGAGATAKIEQLRARLGLVAPFVDSKLAADGRIDLGGVKVTVHRGAESINFGPGTAHLGREDGHLAADYESSPSSDGKSFRIRTKLPAAEEPFAIDFQGGPITLATLGVKDGDFKLLDVAESTLTTNVHLELAPDGGRVTASGDGTLEKLAFDAKAISPEPVRGLRVSFSGKGSVDVDGSRAHVEQGELEIGALDLKGDLDYQRIAKVEPGKPPQFKLRSNFEFPLTPCQSLLDSAPKGLLPTVYGVRMAGSLALKGHASFDTTNLDKDYDVDWALANSCRVTEIPPALDVKRFHKAFKRSVYTPEGKTVEIDSGPGSGNWVAYSHISKFMELAVISFEDGRFESHDGFDHEAIKNSIRENLRTGKFVRGASTISMQLAKNVYLARDKTLSRKLEEAILTMYLEQSLTKEQMMELYLNVIELGPMVYGVEAAASHYFHASAAQLTLSQAFYLGSILPNPQVSHFAAGGAVSPGWMTKLRTVMRYAHKRNRLTDEELEEGSSELPVRGSPAPIKDTSAAPASSAEGAHDPTDPAAFQLP